ncbi:ribonuclease HII [Candidatus Kaiserbacteria bacterium]|nr:ribonuclease HII [Candidatus Kaiserbacteria bacterium]
MEAMRYLIGVDEAGRAPLAGPVSVAAVMVPESFDVKKIFPTVKDSKLLTPERRWEIFKEVVVRTKAGEMKYCVRFSDHLYIDEYGITRAVRRAVMQCVSRVSPQPEGVHVYLDGLLYAPSKYRQETIINGDALIPVISLASVIAKVQRDKLMVRYAKLFPHYGFELHKGYGTKKHWAALREHGMCDIHRRSYCARYLEGAVAA